MRRCPACATSLEGRHPLAVYCSDACRVRACRARRSDEHRAESWDILRRAVDAARRSDLAGLARAQARATAVFGPADLAA